MHNGFLKLTSGTVPADLLVASMVAEIVSTHLLFQAVVGLGLVL